MKKKLAKNVRLSRYISPTRYSLTLTPNLKEFTFSGEEVVEISLGKSVKEITLHAAELKILSAELHHGSS